MATPSMAHLIVTIRYQRIQFRYPIGFPLIQTILRYTGLHSLYYECTGAMSLDSKT